MELDFTKEIIDEYNLSGYGLLYQCRLYKVYQGGLVLGKFFCADEVAFFSYGNNKYDFRIDITRKMKGQSAYVIVDQDNHLPVGDFNLQRAESNHHAVGQLRWDKQVFDARPLTPDVKEQVNIFSAATRGHYALQLFSDAEQVLYSIKIELPYIYPGREDLLPGTGKIQASSGNVFLLFSGLFLLEEFLWKGSKRGYFDAA